jgi:hypothetical protein
MTEPDPIPPPIADASSPPHVAAIPPCPMAVRVVSYVRWASVAGLFALGLWLAYGGFNEAGLAILLLAITQLGAAMEMTAEQRRTLELVARSVVIGVATAHGVKQVQQGVDDIRSNPAQGGTPPHPDHS